MLAESPIIDDTRMVRLDEVNPANIPWLPAPIARATMYRYAAGGPGKPQLRTFRVGAHRYVTSADLREFLGSQTIGNQPAAPRPAARQRSIERAKRLLQEAGI